MRNIIIITIVALLTWCVGNAHAENVCIEDVTLNVGATKTVTLSLPQISEGLAGFQFDIAIPEELELVADVQDELFTFDAYLSEHFTVNIRQQDDGSYRLMAYSPSVLMVPLSGTEHVTFQLKADKKAKDGTFAVEVKDIVFTDTEGVVTKQPDVSGSITVAPPVKVIANNMTSVYGDNLGEFTYVVSSCFTTGTPTISCVATSSSNAGSYEIVVGKGTLETDTVTFVNGILSINKAPLTISVGTYTKKEGDPMPEFTLSYEGWKLNETNDVLAKQPVVTCEATVESGPGEYPVKVSGAEAQNYEISYIAGILIVTERPSYKLTYLVDDIIYKVYEIKEGATIIPETEPEKEGYTFSGWSEIPETMPAHDVTVNGTFSINSYTLTYIIDEEVYKQVVYEYGAAITPEPKPEGDYLSFEWVGEPATMPAHDVTVTAVYETGIAEIMMMVQQGLVRIYNPNGKLLSKLQKGLNIVVMQDGTTKKVLVK